MNDAHSLRRSTAMAELRSMADANLGFLVRSTHVRINLAAVWLAVQLEEGGKPVTLLYVEGTPGHMLNALTPEVWDAMRADIVRYKPWE